ncbi:hypothetical protein FG147_02475 [Thauera sp. UPWRP]|nr:hypothetical protein FG147_02475 [Thauera sp. UPWRP]
MSEPTSTTAAALGGVITVAGVATGLPADMLLPGFVGALWAIRTADEGAVGWRVVQVVVGTLAAAWCAPVLAGMAANTMGAETHVVKFPLALVLGWGGLRFLLPRAEGLLKGGGQ